MPTPQDLTDSGPDHSPREPLAIVGIGCRFPGGINDPDSYWDLLIRGQSAVSEVPDDRWDADFFHCSDPLAKGRMTTRWGGFIDHFDEFDAGFFGISRREAVRMDPQQRWLLEVSWEAIEDAGIPPAKLAGEDVGVFVGISSNDYGKLQIDSPETMDVHTNSGNALSIASNRIAYQFDFAGPAVSVDTACSSALVAADLACRSIWSGQCRAALAGGANALILPDSSIGFSRASMLSPSGRCFAFDARADGYVRGEGAGMILIEPAAEALEQGHPIYALIRSTMVNQDGRTSSMTVPDPDRQSRLFHQALAEACLPAECIEFVEAHGTGTQIGDPVEARALGKVLSQNRDPENACVLGSVKTNIGHLESAAGVAGIIKAALVLRHGLIPANLNFSLPNPHIPFDELRLRIATANEPLPNSDAGPSFAAVNSFGFGGTNAIAILESAPESSRRSRGASGFPKDRLYLLPVSGRSIPALRDAARQFGSLLESSPAKLGDLCFAAARQRQHHREGLVAIGRNRTEIRTALDRWLEEPRKAGDVCSGSWMEEPMQPVFVFAGQGAQWWAMGRQLLERERVFRETVEAIDAAFAELADRSLIEELLRPEDESNILRTEIAQPAIFAVQAGLAALWNSWGITPAKVVGHSVGEVAAAHVAGIFPLEVATAIVFHRSRLQGRIGRNGGMAVIAISPEEARDRVADSDGRIAIAGFNSPNQVTLAGEKGPLDAQVAAFEREGRFVRRLPIRHGFHTRQMDPIQAELLASLGDPSPSSGLIPFVSTVTGTVLSGENLDADYWWDNVRQPVLFEPAMATLIESGERNYVEIGPHPALKSSIVECFAERRVDGKVFHSLKRGAGESREIRSNLALLHLAGVEVDWEAVNGRGSGEFLRLPRYPWQHERFWLEAEESARHRLEPSDHPLLGCRLTAPQPRWESRLDPRCHAYLADHLIWDRTVFPGAGYGEIGLAIARRLFPDESRVVEDLEIRQALFLCNHDIRYLRVEFEESEQTFRVSSRIPGTDGWSLNAEGRLPPDPGGPGEPVDLGALRNVLPNHIAHWDYAEMLRRDGFQFGPSFRRVEAIWWRPGESLAEVFVPSELNGPNCGYHFHPVALDACFQTIRGALEGTADFSDPSKRLIYLPAGVRRIHLRGRDLPERFWVHTIVKSISSESILADIRVFDREGAPLADILDFRLQSIQGRDPKTESIYYRLEWEPCRLAGSRVQEPCRFPDPPEIAAVVNERFGASPENHDLDRFLPDFDRVLLKFVINSFLEMGWNPQEGDTNTLSRLRDRLGVASEYLYPLECQLDALTRHRWLRQTDERTWEVVRPLAPFETDKELERLESDHPRFTAELDLLRLTGPAIGAILTGRVDSTDLLFRGDGLEATRRCFSAGPLFGRFNRMIAEAVKRATRDLPQRRLLRVLDLGSMAGSLSRELLAVLPPDRTEYCLADTGPNLDSLTREFEEKYPLVTFTRGDSEGPLESKEIPPGPFDIIAVSYTPDLVRDRRESLGLLEDSLAPGGLLMMVERTGRKLTSDFMSGLLQGWWRYADRECRETFPPSRYDSSDSCKAVGLSRVACFDAAPGNGNSMASILVARKREAPPESAVTDSVSKPSATPNRSKDRYLVFADRGGVAEVLIPKFEERGATVVRIEFADRFLEVGDNHFAIRPNHRSDLETLFKAIRITADPPAALVHLWSLDHPDDSKLNTERLAEAQETGVLGLLETAKALAGTSFKTEVPRVFLFARQSSTRSGPDLIRLASAPMTGFSRVANNEHPEFRWTVIELEAGSRDGETDDIVDEVTFGDSESEISYRDGVRFARRVRSVRRADLLRKTRNAVGPDGVVRPFRVEIDSPGDLGSLSLNETSRREPAPNEIEVKVAAAGVNFRDLMKALRMYPGEPSELSQFGDDFSGTVVRTGSAVTLFRPGDAVFGIGRFSFQSHVLVDERMVFPLPDSFSFAEAATIPTVFLTAHYCINHLARMRAGESILIHAGTGGVGQAAIQIARDRKLTIFSTAGTEAKRRLLREMGVDYAMDSRSLKFADEIRDLTGGRGVDAVLNSLSGEFVSRNLSILAPFGRYLEIGKIDIFRNRKIGMKSMKDNVAFYVVDMAQHLESNPDAVRSIFDELTGKFADTTLRPISHHPFPVSKIGEAFRFMSQGKHIGKIVLDFDLDEVQIGPVTEEGRLFNSDGSYLIAGGAGGFGLEAAKWMACQGARHLVLLSRSGPRSGEERAAIEALRNQGIEILELRCDIADFAAVEVAVAEIDAKLPKLRGVIHAAMVLDNRSIADLDTEGFLRALRPKMLGGWNLHAATLGTALEHFICFSSLAGVIGAPKQSNYNAGNVFLDALAARRHAMGLPALSIDWGALVGAGYLERNEKTRTYLELIGVSPFDVNEAMGFLKGLLSCGSPQVVVSRIHWKALSHVGPAVASLGMYAPVISEAESGATGGAILPLIRAADGDRQIMLIEDFITRQIAEVTETDSRSVDRETPVSSMGLDSLMAVELLNRVEGELQIQIPLGRILSGATIREMVNPVREAILSQGRADPESVDSESKAESVGTRDPREDSLNPIEHYNPP